MTLPERCEKFIAELSVPVTKFCQKINLSRTCFYYWKDGKINLSTSTLNRIDEYLKQYGF